MLEYEYSQEQFKNILVSDTHFYSSYPQYFTTWNLNGEYIQHHSWNLNAGWHTQRIIYDYFNGEFHHWVNDNYKGNAGGPATKSNFTGGTITGGRSAIQPAIGFVA